MPLKKDLYAMIGNHYLKDISKKIKFLSINTRCFMS